MTDSEDKKLVFTAADSLVALGQEATLAAVTDELGGGDAADILPALQEWRSRRAIHETRDAGEMWENVIGALSALGPDVAALAQAPAVDADIAQRLASLEHLPGVLNETTEALEETQTLLEQRDARVAELEKALATALADSGETSTLQTRLGEMEAAIHVASGETEDMRRSRDAALAQAKRERHRAEQAEAQLEQVNAIRDETADTLADSMRARLSAEQESDDLHARIAGLEDRLAEAETAEAEAAKALSELTSGLDTDREWTLSAEDWPELPRQLAIAAARTAALRAERDALKNHLADARDQIAALNGLLEIRLSSPTTVIQAGGGGGEGGGEAPAPRSGGGGRARLSVVRK